MLDRPTSLVGRLDLSCTVLVTCSDVEGGEDVVGGVGQTWCGGEVVAVEVDGDLLQAA